MSNQSNKLEKQADLLFDNVAGWEKNALKRIGRRVKEIKSLSYADLQALNNATIVKQDINIILKELAELTKQNAVDVEQIYSEMIDKQHNDNKVLYDYRNKEFIPYQDNKQLQSIVRAYARTTAETMVNLSMTKARQLGTVDTKGKFVPLEKEFKNVLDKAVMSITTGTGDFNSEMRSVLTQLGGSGIRVDYGGGVTRRLDTMVRQNLLWGAKQASVEYNEMIGEELNCDGIEIDWHSNPRPSHEFLQGKQYSLNGKKTVNGVTYESADKALDALMDYGCLHFKTPIILGVSEPRYSSEELKRLNEENSKPITIDGVTKSGYEWKQTMRRLETEARKTKGQIEILKANGDSIGVEQLKYKLNAIKEKYKVVANGSGIKAQPEKMSIVKGNAAGTSKKFKLMGVPKIAANYTKSEREFMRAQLPRGMKDTTKPGHIISQEQLELFAEKAKRYGIKLDEQIGVYGGFEKYRGDASVLDDALERIQINKKELTKPIKDDTILLRYADVLDENGAIDINAFAQAKGRTITLNRFMYDDTEYLKKEYLSAVQKGIFTKGTDYRNVIDHEMGHIFNKADRSLLPKTIDIIEREAKNLNITVREFIEKNISKYAWHSEEIIAEINAMRKGTVPGISKTIWKEITSR